VKKTRDILINLREIASVSAVFRSVSARFDRFNREVVYYVGAAPSLPALARTEGRRQTIVLFQGARRNGASPRACSAFALFHVEHIKNIYRPANWVFTRHFHFFAFSLCRNSRDAFDPDRYQP
jgi:hypothetical protein